MKTRLSFAFMVALVLGGAGAASAQVFCYRPTCPTCNAQQYGNLDTPPCCCTRHCVGSECTCTNSCKRACGTGACNVDCNTCIDGPLQGYQITSQQLAAVVSAYPSAATILQRFAKTTEESGITVYPIGFFTGTHEKLNDKGETVGLVHFYGALSSSAPDELVFDLAYEQNVQHPGYSPMVHPPSVRVTFDNSHAVAVAALSPEVREMLDRKWAGENPQQ